jgi:tryptophan 7-halogenase
MPPEHLDRALADLKSGIAGALSGMPSHQAFLDNYCSAATP